MVQLRHLRVYFKIKKVFRFFHCVKSVRIRNFTCPYFPAFGLNTESYSVNFCIQSECGKIRTRKTPNMDTFYSLLVTSFVKKQKLYTNLSSVVMELMNMAL